MRRSIHRITSSIMIYYRVGGARIICCLKRDTFIMSDHDYCLVIRLIRMHKSSIISRLFSESRFPVGSSARRGIVWFQAPPMNFFCCILGKGIGKVLLPCFYNLKARATMKATWDLLSVHPFKQGSIIFSRTLKTGIRFMNWMNQYPPVFLGSRENSCLTLSYTSIPPTKPTEVGRCSSIGVPSRGGFSGTGWGSDCHDLSLPQDQDTSSLSACIISFNFSAVIFP